MQNKQNHVYIVGFWPDYEEYFFQDIQLPGYQVEVVNPLKILNKKPLFKYLPRFTRNKQYKKLITKLIHKHPDAIYIFQEFRLLNEFLIETPLSFKGHVLLRNSVVSNQKTLGYIEQLKAKSFRVWSFDEMDAKLYQLHHYNQLIRAYPNIADTAVLFDFAFVGRDKGRADYLNSLKDSLAQQGLTMNIDIRGSNKQDSISYEAYLQKICEARCIVDIVQEQQSGLTLRPLEALVYKRKLITNNEYVKHSKIYHPNNIYLLDDDLNLNDISEFLDKPFIEIPKEIVEQYSAEKIVGNIVHDR